MSGRSKREEHFNAVLSVVLLAAIVVVANQAARRHLALRRDFSEDQFTPIHLAVIRALDQRGGAGTARAHSWVRLTQFSQKPSGSVVSWLLWRYLRAHPHGVSGALDRRGGQRDGAGSQAGQADAVLAEAFG